MAGLPVLKKCGKIQNVVLSSDFEIFSLEMHALANFRYSEKGPYTVIERACIVILLRRFGRR